MDLVFFGSFQHYSTLVLKALVSTPGIEVVGVVTTPPQPVGRKKILTKTDVHRFAETHRLPVHTPENLNATSPENIFPEPPDFFVTAGYGKLLPPAWLEYPKNGSLNLHFSLLPKFRGANPAEWAILLGETETGVTLIQMSEKFDEGAIINQAAIPIEPQDTRETLYRKLYALGADKLPAWLQEYSLSLMKERAGVSLVPQPPSPTPPAHRFTREHGFVPWEIIRAAMKGKSYNPGLLPTHLRTAASFLHASNPAFIDRAVRALSGFPGVWTYAPTKKGNKRLIVIKSHLSATKSLVLDEVQLEGLTPTPFNQIKKSGGSMTQEGVNRFIVALAQNRRSVEQNLATDNADAIIPNLQKQYPELQKPGVLGVDHDIPAILNALKNSTLISEVAAALDQYLTEQYPQE